MSRLKCYELIFLLGFVCLLRNNNYPISRWFYCKLYLKKFTPAEIWKPFWRRRRRRRLFHRQEILIGNQSPPPPPPTPTLTTPLTTPTPPLWRRLRSLNQRCSFARSFFPRKWEAAAPVFRGRKFLFLP